MKAVQDRFWAKVDKTETCWLWTACKDSSGYGMFKLNGRMVKAHRFSYEMHRGPIPEGLVIDHMCHVPRCLNPAHLQAVTHKQNTENRVGANANSKTGVRGVCWHKATQSWVAQVRHGEKVHHLGLFATVEEASAAAIAGRTALLSNALGDYAEAAG